MTSRALAFLWLVTLLGAAAFISALLSWQTTSWPAFFVYIAVFTIASCLKVWLPGITGTMSMNFVFVLLMVLELSYPETLAVVIAGTLAQMYWRPEHLPSPAQVSFNVANMVISTSVAFATYHGGLFAELGGSDILRLAFAACLFFTMNTLSVSVIVGLTEHRSPLKIWRECYLWSFPYYMVGGAISFGLSYSHREFGWQVFLLVAPVLIVLYKSFQLYFSRSQSETFHAKEMSALHLRTIEALAAAIEAKDESTHDHLARVQVYAVEMAKRLGLDDSQVQALRAAAILHDIGKLAVPEHIISKPGRLTRGEFEKMKIHPCVGAAILERVGFPYPVVPIVRHHHEKWDGSGYPDGLRGEEIPVGARILSVVDCLDALASDRSYRKALPLDEAMGTVLSEAGVSYDPALANLLAENYAAWEQLARQLPEQRQNVLSRVEGDFEARPASGLEGEKQGGEELRRNTGQSGGPSFVAQIAAARQEVQALYELSLDLGNSLSVEETMSVLDLRLARLISYDTIAVYVLTGECFRPEYLSGRDRDFFKPLKIPLGEGLAGWVAENRRSILNGNPAVEAGYLPEHNQVSTLRSALAVPLVHLDEVEGVIALYSQKLSAFSEDDLRVIEAIAPKLTVALKNVLRFRSVQSEATTDALTGLPNARSLFLRVDQEIARNTKMERPLALFVCDLDGFKQVNDRFGHFVGNKFLQLIAKRLQASFREYDYLARMGGDEFVVLVPDVDEESADERISQITRIVENVGFEVCGEMVVSVSVGAAHCPTDGVTAESILDRADERMYEMKRAHKQAALTGDLQKIASAVRDTHRLPSRNRAAGDTTSSYPDTWPA